MVEAVIKTHKLHDVTHFGIRVAVGIIFMIHSTGKFNPQFQGFFTGIGLPSEMQIPIALAELVGGILLVTGVLTRITSSVLAIDMLGAIFLVKKLKTFSGQGGWEFELLILAILLVIIVIGPGRVSISHIAKRIPRFLQ